MRGKAARLFAPAEPHLCPSRGISRRVTGESRDTAFAELGSRVSAAVYLGHLE